MGGGKHGFIEQKYNHFHIDCVNHCALYNTQHSYETLAFHISHQIKPNDSNRHCIVILWKLDKFACHACMWMQLYVADLPLNILTVVDLDDWKCSIIWFGMERWKFRNEYNILVCNQILHSDCVYIN